MEAINSLMSVSIITVVLNDIKNIENTIKSVMSQKYSNFEYIIIDGGSNDGTIDVIKKYEHKIDKWISEPDEGVYDAMNKGLAIATGNYVWFINSGDLIYNNHVLDKVFKTCSVADVYFGKTLLFSLNDNFNRILDVPDKLDWHSLRFGKMPISHQSIIVRKSMVNSFDLRYKISSDFDWTIKVLKKANKIVKCDFVIAKYLIGGISWSSYQKYRFDNLKIIKKHFSRKIYFANLIIYVGLYVKWLTEKGIKMIIPDFDLYILKSKIGYKIKQLFSFLIPLTFYIFSRC